MMAYKSAVEIALGLIILLVSALAFRRLRASKGNATKEFAAKGSASDKLLLAASLVFFTISSAVYFLGVKKYYSHRPDNGFRTYEADDSLPPYHFGLPKYCDYSIAYKNIRIIVGLDSTRTKVDSSMIADSAIERVNANNGCDTVTVIPENVQIYLMESYSLDCEKNITILYRQVKGMPQTEVQFHGKIIGSKLRGVIQWHRYDFDDSVINYTVRDSVVFLGR